MKLSLIVSLLFLFGCVAVAEPEKPEVVNTSIIRVSGSQCGPTPSARMELDKLGEKLVASALMKVTPTDTLIVTFFSSPETGEWSVMIDGKNGTSCMVMWGGNWRTVRQETGQES